jgi:hypothetical protein
MNMNAIKIEAKKIAKKEYNKDWMDLDDYQRDVCIAIAERKLFQL